MSYEYTDLAGVRMNIDGYTTEVNLYLTKQPNQVSTIIPATHAPAVALAILEAAGYGKTEAAGFVRGQVEALVKRAERDAEDVKVSVYRLASLVDEPVATWEQLSEDHKERWRTSYRNTRDFFRESP